jgi:signal peptidase II
LPKDAPHPKTALSDCECAFQYCISSGVEAPRAEKSEIALDVNTIQTAPVAEYATRPGGWISPMKTRLLGLLILLLGSVGCDQVSKHAAIQWLSGQPARSYLGDTLRLLYAENNGAFLGVGATWPELLRFILLTLVSSTFVVLALAWLLLRVWSKPHSMSWPTLVGSALLLSGGLGNIIDRTLRNGAVVDFLNVGMGPIRSGIFNVADLQIVVGALILAFGARWKTPRHLPAPTALSHVPRVRPDDQAEFP